MSISSTLLGVESIGGPASRASARHFLGWKAKPGQHHEHQLDTSWGWKAKPDQHHEHQLDASGGWKAKPGQHHEHQLDNSGGGKQSPTSIMSISSTLLRGGKRSRASIMSNSSTSLGVKAQPGQHHEHPLETSGGGKFSRASNFFGCKAKTGPAS